MTDERRYRGWFNETIREVMLEHLTALGWPDMSRDAILHEVPAMWEKIVVLGLQPPGVTWELFVGVAFRVKLRMDLDDIARGPRRERLL